MIRAGWGEGEQVAEGQWLHAVELPLTGARARVRRRASALRPDERLAEMLAARERPLLCEELTLRARLDLDQGRLEHATIELDRALLAALGELADEQRSDLPLRVAELQQLHASVAAAARGILGIETPPDGDAGARAGATLGADATSGSNATSAGPGATSGAPEPTSAPAPTNATAAGPSEVAGMADEEAISHALGRLEAALRARSAAGTIVPEYRTSATPERDRCLNEH